MKRFKLFVLVLLWISKAWAFPFETPEIYFEVVNSPKSVNYLHEEFEKADQTALECIEEILDLYENSDEEFRKEIVGPIEHLKDIKGTITNHFARDGAALLLFGVVPVGDHFSSEDRDLLNEIGRYVSKKLFDVWIEGINPSQQRTFISELWKACRKGKHPFFCFLQDRLKRGEINPNLCHCLYGELWCFCTGSFKHTKGEKWVKNQLHPRSAEIYDIIEKFFLKFADTARDSDVLSIFYNVSQVPISMTEV